MLDFIIFLSSKKVVSFIFDFHNFTLSLFCICHTTLKIRDGFLGILGNWFCCVTYP